MKNTAPFVISISRQLGSGGAFIGRSLARKLNLFYADREIISRAAKDLSVLTKDVESHDEKILSFWQAFIQSFALAPDVYIPPQIIAPTDSVLFETESKIIERIARERRAVIIGRCGFHVLREHPNHVSLFLHGNIDFRRERIRKLYNIPEKAAAELIAKNDAERAAYNHKFTGREWADATQYNLTIDTSKIGLDKAMELILRYLELRQ